MDKITDKMKKIREIYKKTNGDRVRRYDEMKGYISQLDDRVFNIVSIQFRCNLKSVEQIQDLLQFIVLGLNIIITMVNVFNSLDILRKVLLVFVTEVLCIIAYTGISNWKGNSISFDQYVLAIFDVCIQEKETESDMTESEKKKTEEGKGDVANA